MEDSDESDIENDEFDNPLVQPTAISISIPMPETPQEKEAKSREERTTQEAILGRLFGIEKDPVIGRKEDQKALKGNAELTASKSSAQDLRTHKDSIENVFTAITSLLAASEQCSMEDLHKEVPVWATIQDIAQKMVKISGAKSVGFVDNGNGNSSATTGSKEAAGKTLEKSGEVETTSKEAGDSAAKSASAEGSSNKVPDDSAIFEQSSSQQSKPVSSKTGSMRPEDIDIEHPDDIEDEDGEQQEFVDEAVIEVEASMEGHAPDTMEVNSSDLSTNKEVPADPRRAKVIALEETIVSKNLNTLSGSVPDVSDGTQRGESSDAAAASSSESPMKEYIRSTRKLALRSFSLYLIPIKASIIHRAIDLHVLHRITLLNVGPQAPLWRQMLVMQRSSPLNLQCVYTDDVSIDFLVFVRELNSLTEAFLLERSRKSKINLDEAPSVGIESIRKYLLKKHMRSLKRLMIKNENDKNENDNDYHYRWDINEKAMSLITKKGNNLTELAIGLGLRSFVS